MSIPSGLIVQMVQGILNIFQNGNKNFLYTPLIQKVINILSLISYREKLWEHIMMSLVLIMLMVQKVIEIFFYKQ